MRLVAFSAAVFASAIGLAASGSVAPVSAAENANNNAKTAKTVTVQPGDYLDKIAKENGSNWKRMFYANQKIADPDVINPGEKLKVPAADAQLTPRPIPSNAPAPAPAPAQPTAYTPAPAQPAYNPAPAAAASASGGVWDQLAQCESGGNWNINTGNGFSGGLQFHPQTWAGHGGTGAAHNASKAEQIAVAKRVQASQGWGAWPACSAKLGL